MTRLAVLLFLAAALPATPPDPAPDRGIGPGYNVTEGRTAVDPGSIPNEKRCVIAAFGQSNGMANFNNYLSRYTVLNSSVIYNLNIYDGKIYRAESPLLGAGGLLDNWGNEFADKLVAGGYCNSVILVPCSIGLTSVAEWAAGGDMNPRIAIAAQWLKIDGLVASAVLFQQGETDNIRGVSGSAYATSLASVIASIQSSFPGVPVFISQTTYFNGTISTAISDAQLAATDGKTIFAAGNSDTIGNEGRHDNIHFNLFGSGLWTSILVGNIGPNLIVH